jgi:hypothetical protein
VATSGAQARRHGSRRRPWERRRTGWWGEYMPGAEIEDRDDTFMPRFLFAFWRLCQQRIATADGTDASHSAQVAADRAGVSPDVRIVRLRRREQPAKAHGGSREWHHRWPVRMLNRTLQNVAALLHLRTSVTPGKQERSRGPSCSGVSLGLDKLVDRLQRAGRARRRVSGWGGPGRPAVISHGGFPRSACRTRHPSSGEESALAVNLWAGEPGSPRGGPPRRRRPGPRARACQG